MERLHLKNLTPEHLAALDLLRARTKYLNMPTICEDAEMNYKRFRNWMCGPLKALKLEEVARINLVIDTFLRD